MVRARVRFADEEGQQLLEVINVVVTTENNDVESNVTELNWEYEEYLDNLRQEYDKSKWSKIGLRLKSMPSLSNSDLKSKWSKIGLRLKSMPSLSGRDLKSRWSKI